MRTSYCIGLFAIVLAAGLHAQVDDYDPDPPQDDYTFQALVRIDDSGPGMHELVLASGAMGTMELGNGYRLDITAPGLAPKGTESAVFILRHLQQDRWLPLHTFRQPMRGAHDLKVGYLICRQHPTLVFPVAESLSGC